ncbi:TPA: histidinol phosphate phosphatase [Candidatus Dependentiae bacterium]|nr:MAG: hypothetical protein A2Y17_09925 [Clostridiales bacterium GWF2_38_85]HBL98993.1 histidinol phosphate phosphatase [Candidatus Dependentiae bacterium]
MFVDCHVHSSFSPDGKQTVFEACESAKQHQLHGLIFTDHVDFDMLSHPDLSFDPIARKDAITLAREQYGSELHISEGVELGFQSQVIGRMKEFVESYPFDFVILSTHGTDRLDCCDPRFHEKHSPIEACQAYLDAIYRSVTEFDNFDVIGHIGYVLRYLPSRHTFREVAGCNERIDAILEQLVAKGKGLEINTSGYRHVMLGETLPADFILRRFCELGGEIITLGSDGHMVKHVGFAFERAAAVARDSGFRQVAFFVQRKPVFISLDI